MPPRPLLLVVIAAGVLAHGSCRRAPATPAPGPGDGAPQQITGNERLGWDQQADASELPLIRFAIYVDGIRSEVQDASCGPSPGASGFPCTGRLPPLSTGPHTLELAAFTVRDGNVIESARSAPLEVSVVGASATWGDAPAGARVPSGEDRPTPGTAVTTADGVRLRVEVLAQGLSRPTDLAFGPSGSVFVAEQSGRILVVGGGAVPRLPAEEMDRPGRGDLLALTVDPAFEETRLLYAVYAAVAPTGAPVFQVARLQQVGDAFVEHGVILDDVPAPPAGASAALRFGPDGKLYAAFDTGGDSRLPGDLASFNGKVLRLNPDGTTPPDQPAASPVHAYPISSPLGMDWDPRSGVLWVAEASADGTNRLAALVRDDGTGRATERSSYHLPGPPPGGTVAFYGNGEVEAFRDSLFIAADEAILRLGVDPGHPTRIASTEVLFQPAGQPVHVVAVGPDGAIYFCAGDVMGRLRPEVPGTGGSGPEAAQRRN